MNVKDNTSTPILITGVERSGSSLVARILEMCGAYTGCVTPMYENKGIKELVDGYYVGMDMDIRGQFPLPKIDDLSLPANWKNNVLDCLKKEGWDGEGNWVYKSSRICQIWPVWNYAFPESKVVIVRRRTPDVINSCMKTAFMDSYARKTVQWAVGAETEKEGWLWWIHQHEFCFREMIEEGMNCKVVWPERMVEGNYKQMWDLIEWLGLKWNPKVMNFVNEMIK